jgi:hypothetical protein
MLMAAVRQEVNVQEAKHEQYRVDGLDVRTVYYR